MTAPGERPPTAQDLRCLAAYLAGWLVLPDADELARIGEIAWFRRRLEALIADASAVLASLPE